MMRPRSGRRSRCSFHHPVALVRHTLDAERRYPDASPFLPNCGGSKLPGRLEKKITEDLGGLDKFEADFASAGVCHFGSGWCWLSVKNGKLEISKTANGESPLVHGATPILGCDVWEHSYYIDYRNRRPDYLKAFVDSLVNWEYVDQLFSKV